jgi:uncharacterized membrane protein YbhN (UPF0104 family)
MDDVASFDRALRVFADRLSDIRPLPLAIALALHVLSLGIRARVWCGILRVALPGRDVPLRPIWWAYLAGVGANAIAPARGGDVIRLYAARRALPGASVATLVATLVAETAFGAVVVVGMAVATASAGWLPPLVQIPDAAAFEISFYARHVLVTIVAAALVVSLGALALQLAGRRLDAVRRHIWQGLRILESPRLFGRIVALPQLADWILRAAIVYALLSAFGIHASVRAALLVLVVDSTATALPFTPGGAGAQQGLLVLALGGTAATSQILAFSVGSQLVMAMANIALGLVALVITFGHARVGRIRSESADFRT